MVNMLLCFIANIVAARVRSDNQLATKSGSGRTNGGYICRCGLHSWPGRFRWHPRDECVLFLWYDPAIRVWEILQWPGQWMCSVRKGSGMAKLVFGMNQSLDGYVDHMAFAPSPTLFRHFIEEAQGQAGSVYGRKVYEVMRYWDDDHPEWDAEEHAFAAAWRKQPKWVVSRSLKSVGPNARLVENDLEGAIRELKAERDGEIEVAGPDLAQSLTELGLIDEYRIYLHPVVLGHGKPYFAGPRPPLRLVANDRIGEDVIRLAYVPA